MKRSTFAVGATIITLLLVGASCYSSKSSTPNTNTSTKTTTNSQTTSNAVTIQNFSFSPTALTVTKGTTVTWTNNDSAAHTITGDNGGPASGSIASGQSYNYAFNTAGTFSYHCALHPSMTATVTVTQ